MSVSKRGKRSGNPHISFRLDRDLTEFLKAQPEGVRAYLSRLIQQDKEQQPEDSGPMTPERLAALRALKPQENFESPISSL